MVEALGELAARRAGARRAPSGCRRSAACSLLRRIVGADARVEVVGPARDADDDDVGVGGRPLEACRQADATHRQHGRQRRSPHASRVLLQLGEQRRARRAASCDRRRCAASRCAQPIVGGRRLEQPELLLRLRRRAADRRPAAARQLVALERGENLAGALDDRPRQAREARHLDAVAAIGSPGHDLAQEDDVVLPLARRDVEVDDARRRVGQIGQLVVVRGEERLRPQPSGWSPGARRPPTRCSGRRRSPCRGRSRRARRGCATSRVCRMLAVSCISTMNVEWPRAMLSDAPTRAKMRSTSGDLGFARRHERSGLRHHAEERRLPQVGRLAAHVRPGQDDQLARRCRSSVMSLGTNASAARAPLDDRMPRVDDDDLVAVVHVRLGVVVDGGGLGERGEHVERRERARRRLDARRLGGHRARAAPRRSPARARGCARRRRAPSLRIP